jgi:hypothetical protein
MQADDRSTQVIVHEFQVGETAAAGNSAIPETSVFQVASRLTRDAVCEAGWKNLNQRCLKSEFTPQANGEYDELCCAKILGLSLCYSVLHMGSGTSSTIWSGEGIQSV